MEEQATSQRSVAELARRFKGAAPPQSPAGNEQEKPVRRRPPRTLQLSKTQGGEQQGPADAPTSPVKVKRNSGLIEKIQAELLLSPTGPPMKSPGIRMLPLNFPLPSPGSAPPGTSVTTSSSATPTSPVASSPVTETEGPASFEEPATVAEGLVLQSINKGRARHSIRRRPPSRRHRTSSSGEVEAKDAADTQVSSTTDPTDKTAAGGDQDGEQGGAGDVFKKEDQTDAPTAPEKNQTHEEEEPKSGDGDVKEGEKGSVEGEEEEAPSSSSSEKKEEEPRSQETQKQDPTEDATLTDGKEEEQSEEATSSAR
ncbi:duboraya [Pelmatolapia mariae]|uniref:duboraya n=1 Tax=Pelmatolapia mariae TaxID=158779 RepID=UPI002FE5F2FD